MSAGVQATFLLDRSTRRIELNANRQCATKGRGPVAFPQRRFVQIPVTEVEHDRPSPTGPEQSSEAPGCRATSIVAVEGEHQRVRQPREFSRYGYIAVRCAQNADRPESGSCCGERVDRSFSHDDFRVTDLHWADPDETRVRRERTTRVEISRCVPPRVRNA